MSSLIIPQTANNPTLQKNLAALFRRYPHDRARLESVLSRPVSPFPLIKFNLPPAIERPPMRILLLLGIGNPLFLATVLNDPTVERECFHLFVVEQNPEFLAWCFQNADMTQIIVHPKVEWFLLHDAGSIRPALFRALKNEGVSAMLMNVQMFDLFRSFDPSASSEVDVKTKELFLSAEMKGFYESIPSLYNETVQHVLHNYGNLTDSLVGLEFTLKNSKSIVHCPGIIDLKDYFKGAAALVVGAGPSLDENIEAIKRNNDKFVVIAADAALKPLRAAGIRVDFVTSIERDNVFQLPFFKDMEKQDAELVAFPVVHPDVLASYNGSVRLCYRHYSFYAYFNKAYPKGILKCGGSTAHLGARLADWMGCRKLLLVGTDSCYEEKDGLYRSHCKGTGYPEWANFMPLEDFATVRQHFPTLAGVSNTGKPVMTNLTYYQWAKEYSEELSEIGQRMTIINCAANGLAMSGIPYKSIDDVTANIDPVGYEKPAQPVVTNNRHWDHKEILKNFLGWQKLSRDCIQAAEDLLKKEEVDKTSLDILIYLSHTRFIQDNLFVSFAIQCGAMEFFLIENRWWSTNLDPTKDLREKTSIALDRFKLFENTATKLVNLFELEEK